MATSESLPQNRRYDFYFLLPISFLNKIFQVVALIEQPKISHNALVFNFYKKI